MNHHARTPKHNNYKRHDKLGYSSISYIGSKRSDAWALTCCSNQTFSKSVMSKWTLGTPHVDSAARILIHPNPAPGFLTGGCCFVARLSREENLSSLAQTVRFGLKTTSAFDLRLEGVPDDNRMYMCMCVCMVTHIARVRTNRIRLPILLVVN